MARALGCSAFHWRTAEKFRSAMSSSHVSNVRSILRPLRKAACAALSLLSRHGEAAVHADDLAGNIAGVIGSQKGDHGRDFRRLPQAFERNGAGYRTQNLASKLLALDFIQQGRVHQAGA